ncbi:MAG TPA: TlpA disulfide reductase family protein [Conexibacter sp.]|nr:TlpA disulfide reductase family protein [Conexibacter sp.]
MTVLPRLEQSLTDAIRAERSAPRHAPRRRRGRRLTLVLVATLAVSATALAATRPWTNLDDAVDHGQRPHAPDRTLPVLGGAGTESLARFRGQVVILSFFASWCAPCRAQTPLIDRTGRALAADRRGAALLVDWPDDPRAAKDFAARQRLTMPVVTDDRGGLGRAYGLQGLPATFVIDPEGRVVAISRTGVTRRFLDAAIAKAERP